MVKKAIIIGMVFLFTFNFFPAENTASAEEIRLKMAVINPSTTRQQVTPVKYDLPKGIGPEQIIDIGAMELKYDLDNDIYYVWQMVTLEPSERKMLEIVLVDIWRIPDKEITDLLAHMDALKQKLKRTKHFKVGFELAKKIEGKLTEIENRQKMADLNAEKKINFYYENIETLKEIKEDTGMLENLVVDTGGIVENRVDVPETMVVAVDANGMDVKSLELRINIKNSSDTRAQTTFVKYVLPKEITPRHVLDSGGLSVAYDFNKERFYLHKEDVKLEPSEEKGFVVRIQDIWIIPEVEIDALRSHTNNMTLLVEGTEYDARVTPMAEQVLSDLAKVVKTQTLEAPADEHIGYFRENTALMESAREIVRQIEKIISQTGAAPALTVSSASEKEAGGDETRKVRGFEGVSLIIESIFQGKAPSVATTWRIIISIIVFLGIVSSIFFYMQYSEKRKAMIDALTGVLSREYIFEKFKEELKTAGKLKRKCSLLMMDVDGFKQVNDTYGHAAGDTILKGVMLILRKGLVASDLIGRFGGDEFLIVSPNINKVEMKVKGEEIRRIAEDHKIKIHNNPISITLSIGVATYPDDSFIAEDLLNKVDHAMYSIKRKGGNGVAMFSLESKISEKEKEA